MCYCDRPAQTFSSVCFFPANTIPSIPVLSLHHTHTAPYPSAWTLMNRRTPRRRKQMQSLLTAGTANTTTGRSTNNSCSIPLHANCSSTAWTRHQTPAPGIWTDQSRAQWLTAGAQHLRTTFLQAGPAL